MSGATGGIGRQTARELALRGFDLVLAARRKEDLERLAEECSADGVRSLAVPGDLTLHSACEKAIARAREVFPGHSPALVNLMGAAKFGPFAGMPWQEIEEQIAANLLGPMQLCHAVLPWMLESGGGRIVNVLSVAADRPMAGAAAYGAAKAGLRHFGRILSEEVRRKGVKVTNLLPGATTTPLWDSVGSMPEREDMLTARAVAEAIAWVLDLPADRTIDELSIMPPKGVL
ncbi:MAG: SDR family NAD(P)-dependent oxidoreductase [Fimbriimonas ginsengisoli]|uniref:SDR family NAD(P)-dependent oxidoreductase n=1 Tax=Fimbriimonas ginsengisoli TaxID=1005039 RepID=A0A931M1A5_FIMGI|nr:SDR family NAD(P)-dependent oxidoreductase [Fimbriimonas ginsengisoli]